MTKAKPPDVNTVRLTEVNIVLLNVTGSYWDLDGTLVHKDAAINQMYNVDVQPQDRNRLERFFNNQRLEDASSPTFATLTPNTFFVLHVDDLTVQQQPQLVLGRLLQVREYSVKHKGESAKR
jgi:hypothetical protein